MNEDPKEASTQNQDRRPRPSSHPPILVAIYTDYVARDVIESGTLTALRDRFELYFVVTDSLKVDLAPYGTVVGTHSIGGWRKRIWITAFCLRYLSKMESINRCREGHVRRFICAQNPDGHNLVWALHRFRLSTLLSRVLGWLMAWTAPDYIKSPRRPVAAFLPTGINDPPWDDTVTWCRSHNIPSVSTTVNWDNISGKAFLQPPDWLGVWGEQGYISARLLQGVAAQKILVLGAPRFEPYRQIRVTREDARSRLGLPREGRTILFAGAAAGFDEVTLIETFEQALLSGDLPDDLTLLFKPHPKRQPRAAEPALRPEAYKRVHVLSSQTFTPLTEYPVILAAVDGLVSPLSTMILEGMIMGLPVVGLAYSSAAHGDYPWHHAHLSPHLHPAVSGPWFLLCASRNDFLPNIRHLLDLAGNTHVADAARRAAGFIVHEDGSTYAERLCAALRQVAGLTDE